ncbi:hypothetical protein B0F90DRAFT_1181970 [Multifurca ochricompacta]|uniref:F-box domain-containing protein n=1 Tax=Multifurca ochricompacta TaxID=376703 RepID=A0AAD4QMZ1_9AGAM|nr:hypothetical protein B0F90DRAFT_1181970 [Multifurca ochricompacta]
MLHILPPELSLNVLSYLPIPSLLPLSSLSHQWLDFLFVNQSKIFKSAALLHEFIPPGTLLLEDALSMYTGNPWEGSMDWKDFCRRSFHLRKNWEGKGRAVARLLSPPGSDVHRIKVDERAGICITTHMFGGLSVNHLFSSILLWRLPPSYVHRYAHCEYEKGYLVFDQLDGQKDVWCLAGDFTEGEVATYSPPDDEQRRISALSAAKYRQYAPRGQFRPWAKLSFPEITRAYRLAYPTLVCASDEHAFLHDIRTGALVQTVYIHLSGVCYVDVNERHVIVCEQNAVHVFSRRDNAKVLCISKDVPVLCSQLVEDPKLVPGNPFVTPLSLSPDPDDFRTGFVAAHVSRDGRDLAVMAFRRRILLIRDFERICRGETSLESSGLVLRIRREDICCYLGFEHGRICVATLLGLYVFTIGSDLSADAAFVQPYSNPSHVAHKISCMQLTDRRIYFTWENARRRDVPLFQDGEDDDEQLSPSVTPPIVDPLVEALVADRFELPEGNSVGCIDFSFLPES